MYKVVEKWEWLKRVLVMAQRKKQSMYDSSSSVKQHSVNPEVSLRSYVICVLLPFGMSYIEIWLKSVTSIRKKWWKQEVIE